MACLHCSEKCICIRCQTARGHFRSYRNRYTLRCFAMKRPTYPLVFAVLSTLFLLHFFFRNRDDGTTTQTSVKVRPSQQTWVKDRPPKITIIAVWSIRDDTPPYLPYFIQSVEANEQVNLLFVQLVKDGLGCPSYTKAPNIKVCSFFCC